MNSLPGNPHAEALTAMLRDGALSHEALATLALAYEQRTANLIAYLDLWNQIDGTQPNSRFDIELQDRIGLDGDDS